MLRLDSKERGYKSTDMRVTRFVFYVYEIARNKEGLNSYIH